MSESVKKLDLMSVHEIAELLGVSRQRVDQISRADKTFPAPVDTLAVGRIWNRADVEQWKAVRRPT